MTLCSAGRATFNLLHGGDGNDTIVAAAQSNYILADAGADKITRHGQHESDHLSFERATAGLTLDLANAAKNTGLASRRHLHADRLVRRLRASRTRCSAPTATTC